MRVPLLGRFVSITVLVTAAGLVLATFGYAMRHVDMKRKAAARSMVASVNPSEPVAAARASAVSATPMRMLTPGISEDIAPLQLDELEATWGIVPLTGVEAQFSYAASGGRSSSADAGFTSSRRPRARSSGSSGGGYSSSMGGFGGAWGGVSGTASPRTEASAAPAARAQVAKAGKLSPTRPKTPVAASPSAPVAASSAPSYSERNASVPQTVSVAQPAPPPAAAAAAAPMPVTPAAFPGAAAPIAPAGGVVSGGAGQAAPSPAATPEPMTLLLVGGGMAGMYRMRRYFA